MADVSEFIWNLKRLGRDAFPKGLPVSALERCYKEYFPWFQLPTPSAIAPGCRNWLQVLQTDRFKEWFRVSKKKLIFVLPKPERDLKAYFRLVNYTQYIAARQGAKVDGIEVSDSDKSDGDGDGDPDGGLGLMEELASQLQLLREGEEAESPEKTAKKQRQQENKSAMSNPKRHKAASEMGQLSEPEEQVLKAGNVVNSKSLPVALKKHESEIQLMSEQVTAASGSSDKVFDTAVDPDEPICCICHQVSSELMIACDDPHCTIDWFHLGCVGLRSIPSCNWFCPKCQPKLFGNLLKVH